MPIIDILLQIVMRFGSILSAPLKQPDMLWILVPIYITWLISDYFEERKGTTFGQAMTNGAVSLLIGIDWARQTVKNGINFDFLFTTKIAISSLFLVYSLIIMTETARAKPIARYIGRIREIGYFAIVATPIFYGVIQPDLITFAAILVFFPIWYFIFEAIDRALPTPPGEDELGRSDLNMPELEPSGGANLQMPPTGKMPKF